VTLDDYFDRVVRLVENQSLTFEDGFEMLERIGSNGTAGRIRGRLVFSDRTFLSVSEQLEMVDGEPVRRTYAYYCVLDGIDVWAHDNDPSHGIHAHNRSHDRLPDEERSLKEIIEKAWVVASDEDYWALYEGDRV
jgi:hypothetical protein